MKLVQTILTMIALTLATPSAAFQYRTDAYALIADLPDSWHICMDEAPAPNHGFWVLMDRGDCNDRTRLPEVVFSVSYNAAYEYPSTPAMRPNICGRAPARQHGSSALVSLMWSRKRSWRYVRSARRTMCHRESRSRFAFGQRRRPPMRTIA